MWKLWIEEVERRVGDFGELSRAELTSSRKLEGARA
jgi:hypothetical protein